MFYITNNILELYIPEENETDIIIPEGVIAIKPNAFDFEDNITSITFPKSLCAIAPGAIRHCDNLKEITILGDEVTIGTSAFEHCFNLTTIKIFGHKCDLNDGGLWLLTLKMIVSPNISINSYNNLIKSLAYKGYFKHKDLYTNEEIRKDYEHVSQNLALFMFADLLSEDDDEIVSHLLETNDIDIKYIDSFIMFANEHKALKCLSILLDYKHKELNTENIDIKYSLE